MVTVMMSVSDSQARGKFAFHDNNLFVCYHRPGIISREVVMHEKLGRSEQAGATRTCDQNM